jgi:hypothetical protein
MLAISMRFFDMTKENALTVGVKRKGRRTRRQNVAIVRVQIIPRTRFFPAV